MKGEELQYLVPWCIEAGPYAPNIAPTLPDAGIAALQSRCQVETKACIIIATATWWLGQAPSSWACSYHALVLWCYGALVLWTMWA